MDVTVLAIGRLKSGPERDLCDRYLERARKSGSRLGFRSFTVREIAESRAARDVDRMSEEARELIRLAGSGGAIICLDAGGDLLSSEDLARVLQKHVEAGVKRTTFVIGGPDGLGEAALGSAGRVISFGRMTWPHQLVRVLLAEQLYRAMTVLSGHPYHRA